mgnify:CR=1 FL=1|jgi:hypothetical protein
MAPLGLGSGFYGVGPTLSAGESVHVSAVDGQYMAVPTGANGLNLNNAFQSTIRGSFTFATYFFASGKGAGPQLTSTFFGSRTTENAPTHTDEVRFGIDNDGKIAFFMDVKNGGSKALDQTSTSAPFASVVTGWNHIAIAVTNNGPTTTNISTLVVYINGSSHGMTLASVSQITGTEHNTYTSTRDIILGNLGIDEVPQGNNRMLLMKHSALWNSTLNASSITEINDAGINTPLDLTSASGNYNQQGSLVGYWKLTEGSGTTATDETGNNNGTIILNASLI